MSASLQWYDSTDSTANPTLTFSATAGTPTAAQVVRLWNDFGGVLGAATATDVMVTAYSRSTGSGNYTWDHPAAALRWVEVRAVSSAGDGIIDQVTPWTPIGKGAVLSLLPIPGNCVRQLEVRLNVPVGAGTVSVQVLLRAYAQAVSLPCGSGHYEDRPAVHSGVGDGEVSYLLDGAILSPDSPPSADVEYSAAWYTIAGVPYFVSSGTITTNNLDGSGNPLASGESYPITVSLNASGIVVTKGDKGADPLPASAWPAAPAGGVLVGRITRPFSGAIDVSEIDQVLTRWSGFRLQHSPASLTARVHGGRAAVGNQLIVRDGPVSVIFPASATRIVWLAPSGEIELLPDGTLPSSARSIALWRVTTDATGVTGATSLRRWGAAGGRETMLFAVSGPLAVSAQSVRVVPRGGRWYLLPIDSISVALGNSGSGAGSTAIELEYSDAGGTWTTVLSSAISIASGAADPSAIASPALFAVPQGARLRARVTSVPSVPSHDLSVAVSLVCPGVW